ncbi:MAG: hypothetical protein ACR2HH_01865 [Chthoniobacterales bacterium]
MTQIEQLSLDPFLAEYAAGAMVRATKPIQALLAPVVQVPSMVGHFKKHDRDSRLTLPKTRRVWDGRAVQLSITQYDGRYVCEVNALDVPIDKSVGADDLKFLVQDALDLLAEVESQALEFETIAAAVGAAGAGVALDLADANNPIALIDTQLHALMKQARSDGVAVAFDPLAWGKFKSHPKVIALGGANLSWETAPALFAGNARYQACYSLFDMSAEGVNEQIEFQMPANTILIFSRSEVATRRDPSFMKTFRLNPKKTPLKVVERGDGRVLIVKSDWFTDIQVTNLLGVERLNVL